MISTLSILPPPRAVASWVAVCALAGLAGCAGQPATLEPARAGPPIHAGEPRLTASHGETPIAGNFKTATQPKLQAGQHWIAIADDTGRAIVEMLRRRASCGPGADKCSLVQVRPPTPMTEFGRAFHGQIVTTLVQQKVQVAARGTDAELAVDIDVQPVMFAANRPQYRHAGVPVELGPGIWALRDVATPVPVGAGATPPSHDALHWFRAEFAAGQTPRAEILVTVSVADAKRYLARATSAYYIADTDKRLYDKEICALFEPCPKGVAPGGAPGEGKAAVLRVTGDCPLDRSCPEPALVTPAAVQTPAASAPPPAAAPAKKK